MEDYPESKDGQIPPKRLELAEILTTWLSEKQWEIRDFRNLLKGYSLPSLGRDEEPYSWILRGLADLPSDLTTEIAKRIAFFLRTVTPDEFILETDDSKFLYNLFNLSAGVRRREVLCGSLKQVVYYFGLDQNSELRKTIFAEKRYYDIEGSLREAIIVNQDDRSYYPIWRSSLDFAEAKERRSNLRFLGSANPFSAFRGIVLMRNINQPCFEEIGLALKTMADILVTDKNRATKFQQLLARVREIWNEIPYWNKIFIELAVSQRWDKWVAELYPFSIAVVRDDGYEMVETFRESLDQLELESIPVEDFSFHVPTSRQVDDFVDLILSRFARAQAFGPSKSYRSAYVELIQEIFNIMDEPRLGNLRAALKKAHISMNDLIFPNNTRYRTAK